MNHAIYRYPTSPSLSDIKRFLIEGMSTSDSSHLPGFSLQAQVSLIHTLTSENGLPSLVGTGVSFRLPTPGTGTQLLLTTHEANDVCTWRALSCDNPGIDLDPLLSKVGLDSGEPNDTLGYLSSLSSELLVQVPQRSVIFDFLSENFRMGELDAKESWIVFESFKVERKCGVWAFRFRSSTRAQAQEPGFDVRDLTYTVAAYTRKGVESIPLLGPVQCFKMFVDRNYDGVADLCSVIEGTPIIESTPLAIMASQA